MERLASAFASTGRTALRFLSDERGATAIEYALIAAGVGVTVAATVYTLGSSVKANLGGDSAYRATRRCCRQPRSSFPFCRGGTRLALEMLSTVSLSCLSPL